MELSIREMAAIKRVNQNSKSIRNKMVKLADKMKNLADEYKILNSEYEAIEAYVLSKYGFTSEDILSGKADELMAAAQVETEAVVETQTETPAVSDDYNPFED